MTNTISNAEKEKPLSQWQQEIIATALVYIEFAKKSFQRQLQYRIANYSGFAVNTFFFVVRAYVFIALYEHRGVVADYNLTEAVTFTGITQAMLMVVSIFGTLEIANAVKSGEVATDLMKPIDYQLFALANQLGKSFYYLIFRAIPIFLVMAIFFSWTPPHSFFALILFFFSLTIASIITFCMNFMVGMSAFWLMDARGMSSIVMGSGILLSGFNVPISFFPSGLAKVCEWLPFLGQCYTPVAIYLGKYAGWLMVDMLVRQIVWAVILMLLGRTLLFFAMRKITIQGG